MDISRVARALDVGWVVENAGGAGARIGDVAGRGSGGCVSFVRMWRGRWIFAGNRGCVGGWQVGPNVSSRQRWAGSFAV